ncbi:hypothetical protein ACEPPN_019145 [Leptodophora sp. 'Broadleaf-Isolate-01']
MSTFWDVKYMVSTVRNRLKATSSNARITRIPYGDAYQKRLSIPALYYWYNQYMGTVDLGDQLQSYNGGLRRIRRGLIQALY